MLLLCLLLLAAPPDVTVLRWASPDSSKPLSFLEWKSSLVSGPAWNVKLVAPCSQSDDPLVDILVEDSLASTLAPLLDTMMLDIAAEGYRVAAYSVRGTSAESLRKFLRAEYDSGLVAAVLVGDLPLAWFQLIDDWNSNGRRDPDEHYEEFPCDLYLMDIDGNWQDSLRRYGTADSLVQGADGIYDIHRGNVGPEIGISRLVTSTLGNEVELIRQYLDRSHRYRLGLLRVTDRALVYIDDDWYPWAAGWNWDVGILYPDRVFVCDSEVTRAAEYRPRIDTAAYQFIQLCAHSWPGGHQLWYNNKRSYDWFYAYEIPGLDPVACFYNLFACSNVRYTESGYCGGRYVFESSSGLAAIGSTKTGSMLEFRDFYLPLAQGRSLALAFCDWFSAQAEDGFEPWERSWYYGMCLVGDGMLKPRWTVAVNEDFAEPVPRALLPTIVRAGTRLALPAGAALFDHLGRRIAAVPFNIRCPSFDTPAALPAGLYFVVPGPGQRALPLTVVR
ncbi:MAG: hypothetical protein ABIL25_07565 [candidate division WOR-3 bacterium]